MFDLETIEFKGSWRLKKSFGSFDHVHDCFELIYFLEGKGRINAHGTTFHPRLYDLVVFPPGVMHEEISDKLYPEEAIFIAVNIRTDTIVNTSFKITDHSGHLRWLFERVYEEESKADENHSGIINAYLRAIFSLIGRHHSSCSPELPEILNMSISYINDHFQEELSVEKLASMVYVTPYHLIRIFRKNMGMGPMHYLNMTRLEAVKRLLSRNGTAVGEIANLTGFKDSRYFARVFKKHAGVTPSEYRRIMLS